MPKKTRPTTSQTDAEKPIAERDGDQAQDRFIPRCGLGLIAMLLRTSYRLQHSIRRPPVRARVPPECLSNDRTSTANGPRIPPEPPNPFRPVRQVHAHVTRPRIGADSLPPS